MSSERSDSLLPLCCRSSVSPAPAWADFKAGENAYHRGDYATAMREWQPLAKQGHAVAQYNLGLLYANGQGVPKDDAQARQWYEKAAVQGHAAAQVNLGGLYDYGRECSAGFQDGGEMVSSVCRSRK